LGVPAGGTTDQVLAKVSGTDNDTAWVDVTTEAVITLSEYIASIEGTRGGSATLNSNNSLSSTRFALSGAASDSTRRFAAPPFWKNYDSGDITFKMVCTFASTCPSATNLRMTFEHIKLNDDLANMGSFGGLQTVDVDIDTAGPSGGKLNFDDVFSISFTIPAASVDTAAEGWGIRVTRPCSTDSANDTADQAVNIHYTMVTWSGSR